MAEDQDRILPTLRAISEDENEDVDDGSSVQFLLFEAAGGIYGIDILQTHEVLKPQPITRVPNVEREVLGVLNLRGSIIPVIDTAKKFGYDYARVNESSRVIVCTFRDKMVGILVDRVLETARVAEDQIEGAQVGDLSQEYISGVGRSAERIFLILNPDSVLFTRDDE